MIKKDLYGKYTVYFGVWQDKIDLKIWNLSVGIAFSGILAEFFFYSNLPFLW